jgi:predicted enzyme related to lactoylglutathione lyase
LERSGWGSTKQDQSISDASKFYADMLGWQLMKDEKDPSGYIHIKNGENFIGGISPATHRNPNAPPHWLIYFQVADPEAATARVAQLGGKILMPAIKRELSVTQLIAVSRRLRSRSPLYHLSTHQRPCSSW